MFNNGFGAAEGEDQDPQLLEDLFSLQVWHHQEHGVVFKDNSQAVKRLELMSRFDPIKLSITFGKNSKIGVMHGCRLPWPRDAAAILVSLKDLYTSLGLTQFNGQIWRWMNHGLKAWAVWMADLGYAAHLVPSHQMKQVSVSDYS